MTLETTRSFAPVAPQNHYGPQKIADDTYVIRSLWGEGTAPVAVYMNSMVILGKEPVIVDTATEATRRQWMDDVFSLVDPRDVRWVFISHDDHDHVGNLAQTMELCSNATLVTTWFQLERLAGDFNFPLDRVRWVNDGKAFDAGDRLLVAVRPPIFDSPTTRGLYDSRSKVYWASDAFGSPVLKPTENANELDREFFDQGFFMFQSLVSPWHAMLDNEKYNRQIDRIEELDIRTIAGAHGPVLTGALIDHGLDLMRQLPNQDAAPVPGQEVLDQILQGAAAQG